MSDIDKQLRDILLSRSLGQYAADGEGNLVPVNWEDSPLIDQFVGEIKQVTGQEFYYRLAKHLNIYGWTQDEKDSILQAAFEVVEGLDKS